MPNRELTTSTRYVQLRKPANISATATHYANYVDLQGWDAVDFLVEYGDASGASGGFTFTLWEADATPASEGSYTAVASADRRGTALAALTHASTGDVQHIGYAGAKRYAAIRIAWVTDAQCIIGVTAVLRKFGRQPSHAISVTTGTVS